MAFASGSLMSQRTAAVQRPASLIHPSVGRHGIRTRLPCGCSTHNHTCKQHGVTSARAGRSGSAPVRAMSTALTSTTQTRSCAASLSSKGVPCPGFAPAVRSIKRAASVSAADSVPCVSRLPGRQPRQQPCTTDWPAATDPCSLHWGPLSCCTLLVQHHSYIV